MFSDLTQADQVAVYLRLIRRRWWLPIVLAIFSGAVAYAGTRFLIRPVYTSSVGLQVTAPTGGFGFSNSNDANTFSVVMTTAPVENLAFSHLGPVGRRDPGALYGAFCQADTTDTFVTCTTTSHDPRAAAIALNHLARTFVKFNRRTQRSQYGPSLQGLKNQETQLNTEIAGFRKSLSTLQAVVNPDATTLYQINALQNEITLDQGSLSQLAVQESSVRQQILAAQSSVHIINPAVGSTIPISPNPRRNAILGAILGLGLAVALVLLLEFLDDRVHYSEELERMAGASVLGAIRFFGAPSYSASLVAVSDPRSITAEAYRVLRTNLEFVDVEHQNQVILVSSARENEGKTTTSTNLAATMATSGRKVLLVDVDLRRAGLTRRLGLKKGQGLTSALLTNEFVTNAVESEVPNLYVVPSGPLPPNSAQLLESKQMRRWLERVRHEFDIVVLDSPPILSLADSRMLAPMTDGVLLVVDPALTGRRLLRQTRAAIEAVRSRIIGVAINRDPFMDAQHYNSYYYYEGYDMAGPGIQQDSDAVRPGRTSAAG